MHNIEPYYGWRDYYIVEEDENLPFYDKIYSEFEYTDTIYNYYIHPQWDFFGSNTLYLKILYANHDEGYAFIELLGEWNDCLEGDIMTLLDNIIKPLQKEGINKVFFLCDNLFNIFYEMDDYYEELYENTIEKGGFLIFINYPGHLKQEISGTFLQENFYFIDIPEWRKYKPMDIYEIFTGRQMLDTAENY